MTRTALARPICAALLVIGTGGLLAACGGDDSTASSSPSTAGATTSAVPNGSKSPGAGDAPPAVTKPSAAATAPPEQPQAVPSGFPGPTDAPERQQRDKAYLDALKKGGVEPSGNGQSAIDIGNYICAARQQNSPDQEVNVNVTAMAGVELNLAGSQMRPEDAAKVYIDSAKSNYCK